MFTALRSVGLLDILSSMPVRNAASSIRLLASAVPLGLDLDPDSKIEC